MLFVNDFGCQYHAGQDARCTCSIFRIEEDEKAPSHPRVFALPIREGQTEAEARMAYRGQDPAEQAEIEAAHIASLALREG